MLERIVNVVQVLVLIVAGVAVVLLFTVDSGSGKPSSAGATLFADNCARCHGSSGGGGIGPQLSGGKVVKAFPAVPDEMQFVTRGQDGMPAFGNTLSPAEIRKVVDYTRTL